MRQLATLFVIALIIAPAALPAQVQISEINRGTTDLVELANCSGVSLDVSGWVVVSWYGLSGGAALVPEASFTLPARTVIPAQGRLVLTEYGLPGGAGSLPGAMATGFNWTWVPGRALVVALLDANGVGIDYVFDDAFGTGGAPHLPAGTAWSGSLSGLASQDVLHRVRDIDTDSPSDWAFATGSGSPGSLNPGQTSPRCAASVQRDYQVDTPAASLVLDGLRTNGWQPARSVRCSGVVSRWTIASSLPGQPFEIAFSFRPLVARGAVTQAGQILNLDTTDPAFFFINTGTSTPSLSTPFPGSFSVSSTLGVAPVTLATQLLVIDPARLDGMALSQATELVVDPAGVPVPGPIADDASVNVPVVSLPLCAAGPLPVYGTSYTAIDVNSNGRVTFGGADPDFSPTIAEAMSDQPAVGAWADFNPSVGGQIQVSITSLGWVRIDYGIAVAPLQYFGSGQAVTFAIELDPISGEIVLDGLSGISSEPNLMMWLGLSGGSPLRATNPGVAGFAPLTSGVTTTLTDMIFEFGPAGSLAPGVDRVILRPNALGNYDWAAF